MFIVTALSVEPTNFFNSSQELKINAYPLVNKLILWHPFEWIKIHLFKDVILDLEC